MAKEKKSARELANMIAAHASWSAISVGSQGPGIWMGCECVHRASQAGVWRSSFGGTNCRRIAREVRFRRVNRRVNSSKQGIRGQLDCAWSEPGFRTPEARIFEKAVNGPSVLWRRVANHRANTSKDFC